MTCKKVIAAIFVGALFLMLSCSDPQKSEPQKTNGRLAKLAESRKELAAETNRFIEVTPVALAPLKDLNDQELAAVAALFYLDRGVSHSTTTGSKTDSAALSRFQKQVAAVSPALAQTVSSPVKGCINESIACASALAKCEKSGEECQETWVPCAQEVECTMREMENLRRNIDEIFGRLKPPRPIPWPR